MNAGMSEHPPLPCLFPFISFISIWMWLIYSVKSQFFRVPSGLLIALNGPNRRYGLAFCLGWTRKSRGFSRPHDPVKCMDWRKMREITWFDHGKLSFSQPVEQPKKKIPLQLCAPSDYGVTSVYVVTSPLAPAGEPSLASLAWTCHKSMLGTALSFFPCWQLPITQFVLSKHVQAPSPNRNFKIFQGSKPKSYWSIKFLQQILYRFQPANTGFWCCQKDLSRDHLRWTQPKHDQNTFTSSPWFSCVVDTRSGAWSNLGPFCSTLRRQKPLEKNTVSRYNALPESASYMVFSKNLICHWNRNFSLLGASNQPKKQIMFAFDVLPASQFFCMLTKTFQVTEFIAMMKKIGHLEMMVETSSNQNPEQLM